MSKANIFQERPTGSFPLCVDCGSETEKRLDKGIFECPQNECPLIELHADYKIKYVGKIRKEGYIVTLIKRMATPNKATVNV